MGLIRIQSGLFLRAKKIYHTNEHSVGVIEVIVDGEKEGGKTQNIETKAC